MSIFKDKYSMCFTESGVTILHHDNGIEGWFYDRKGETIGPYKNKEAANKAMEEDIEYNKPTESVEDSNDVGEYETWEDMFEHKHGMIIR